MANGCGPEGLGWLVPDFNFADKCNVHDDDYARGGTARDRLRADLKLGGGILRRTWNLPLAAAYFGGVRVSGSRYFNYH